MNVVGELPRNRTRLDSDPVEIRFDLSRGPVTAVRSTVRTSIDDVPGTWLDFGSAVAELSRRSEPVRGQIEGVPFTVTRPSHAGITRRSSRLEVNVGGRIYCWQKRGIIEQLGRAHALYRDDKSIVARTVGLRKFAVDADASPSEQLLAALTFASGITESVADAGLSSLLWF